MSNRGRAPEGSHRTCSDFRRSLAPDRRSFLKAGLLGSAGLALPDLLRAEAHTSHKGGREPSVIILWMRGGPSHIDMWDPKPDAPVEYRGAFGVKPSSVPGILLSDMLPLCGKIMRKWSIIRSLHHDDAGHSTGKHSFLPFCSCPQQTVAPTMSACQSMDLPLSSVPLPCAFRSLNC